MLDKHFSSIINNRWLVKFSFFIKFILQKRIIESDYTEQMKNGHEKEDQLPYIAVQMNLIIEWLNIRYIAVSSFVARFGTCTAGYFSILMAFKWNQSYIRIIICRQLLEKLQRNTWLLKTTQTWKLKTAEPGTTVKTEINETEHKY